MRARTADEQRDKGVGGEPVESRREAVEVALSQCLGGTVYGSDVNKLRTHAEIVLGYVEQWDAWERAHA